jgi:hypothetical protein
MTKPSEGYFYAKREAQDAIFRRQEKYEQQMKEAEANGDVHAHIAAKSKIEALEEFRGFIRNVMLWYVGNGE